MCYPAFAPFQKERGGRIQVYSSGTVGLHNVGVKRGFLNLATLRSDGFAAVAPMDGKSGTWISRPLLCTSPTLLATADLVAGASSGTVSARVEVLGEDAAMGEQAQCSPLSVGSAGATNKPLCSGLPVGSRVRLTIKLGLAELYTVSFAGAGAG